MESEQPKPRFKFPDFVAKFPPVAMPVTLGEDTHHAFSVENKPIPDVMVAQFVHPVEKDWSDDEFTEYLPCFAIEDAQQFIGLVWWKASLLQYEYFLATYTDKGELIDSQVIAYTKVVDGKVVHLVTTITDELEVIAAEGSSSDGLQFDPSSSKTHFYEIAANGMILRT